MLKLPQVASCYFCDIIDSAAGEWNVVERTAETLIVLNGRQYEVGQCMVVPVRHASTILELSESEAAAVMSAAKRLSRMMLALYEPDGMLLYQNNGIGCGQEVPHFHLHVVPRRANSDWGVGPPHIARLEPDSRPEHLDHDAKTDAKLRTVRELRELL